ELAGAVAAFARLVVDTAGQRVRAVPGHPDRHERARHQAARIRQPQLVAAERERHDPARLVHARTAFFARETMRSSSSSETTSFAAKTTTAPPAPAASAPTPTA